MPLKYNISTEIKRKGNGRAGEKALRLAIRTACNRITPATLSTWENYQQSDTHMIPADHLLSIARVLEVDINVLFAIKEEEATA